MGKGTSQSQAEPSSVARPDTKPQRGSVAATASMRRRKPGGGGGGRRRGATGGAGTNFSGGSGSSNSNMLRFYSDDAPGFKMGPNTVLIMSFCFIAFVAALHVFGKLWGSHSAPES